MKEYWLVHPDEGTVITYVADAKGEFRLQRERPFARGEKVPVAVFPSFEVDLNEVFLEDGLYD